MIILFTICAIFIFGVITGTLVKKIGFPEVTGYLIAGILIGPSVFQILNNNMIDKMDIFSNIALSFISFMIGAEFKWRYVKKLGIKPFIIASICSLLTLFLVTVSLLLFGCSYGFSLVMGAIASSTAPAAIMMIVKEYKAKGELTKVMLSVIAIDDVISLFIFGFALSIAKFLNVPGASLMGIMEPFKEMALSLVIGGVIGLLLGISTKLFKTHLNALCMVIAHVFAIILISNSLDISPLLMCMITGIVFVNIFKHDTTELVLKTMDSLSAPILIIFFVISGASLDFSKMKSALLITIIFILSRTVGKVLGAIMGGKLSKSSPVITNLLGPTLLSQTGLAIGLAIVASKIFPSNKDLMTIVIASSFFFDMIGPILTKEMLKKAGDINYEHRKRINKI
ncbi:MAG: cation:proton antiporter [Bacilli bacterium]